MKGIEPSYAAWEAAVLPLNYTRERKELFPGINPAALGLIGVTLIGPPSFAANGNGFPYRSGDTIIGDGN